MRWIWHTVDPNGAALKHSKSAFATFHECVDDAYAQGYPHVEVPVLNWGSAAVTGAAEGSAAPDGSAALEAAVVPGGMEDVEAAALYTAP